MASDAADMEGNSDKPFCCNWVCQMVPQAAREELCHMLKLAGPLVVSQIFNFLLPFMITILCGRQGIEVMAGFGLASAALTLTTAAAGYGLAMATYTLISQTFGGKNLLRVGVILQRAIIILMIFCLPCWALLINAHPIFLLLGQDPEVARIAQQFLTAFLPSVPAMFIFILLDYYMQNQGITLPQMYTAGIAKIASVVTIYIFIYWLDFGVSGSVAAFALAPFYSCGFLFAYIRWKKLHLPTWGGWSVASLQEWGSFMKLAIPNALMVCFEWWIYEFGAFFAGMMSEDELAAQHVLMMIFYFLYLIPLGIEAAVCVRVGNALGAGDTAGAIFSTKTAFITTGIISLLGGVVLGSVKHVIGFIFTSDEKIVGRVSELMTVYCFLQFFVSLLTVSTGIFMGVGKQKIPAVANLIGYFGIGLSLGVTFIFVVEIGILGFWLGLLISESLQCIAVIIIIFKLNWKKLTEEAVKRAQKKTHDVTLSITADLPDGLSGDNTSGQTGTNRRSRNDYTSVSTECHDGNEQMPGGHEVEEQKGIRLSTKQLIVRRGLTLFVAATLLAVGISVHFLVPLPESLYSENNTSLYNNTLDQVNTTFTTDNIFPNEESG